MNKKYWTVKDLEKLQADKRLLRLMSRALLDGKATKAEVEKLRDSVVKRSRAFRSAVENA